VHHGLAGGNNSYRCNPYPPLRPQRRVWARNRRAYGYLELRGAKAATLGTGLLTGARDMSPDPGCRLPGECKHRPTVRDSQRKGNHLGLAGRKD
jgi:hypothetical protein